MCSCDDGEAPDLSNHKRVKAAKDHQCCECGGVIAKGTVHDLYKWLYEGTWDGGRVCPDCEIRQKAFTVAEGCYAPIGTLDETLRECGAEDPDFWRNYIAARRAMRQKKAA